MVLILSLNYFDLNKAIWHFENQLFYLENYVPWGLVLIMIDKLVMPWLFTEMDKKKKGKCENRKTEVVENSGWQDTV